MAENKTEKIMNIMTSKGFFFPASEIYKTTAGFWTYGHMGTLIKRKWENLWRDHFLNLDPNYFEIDDCVIMPKKVFESSGHLDHFNDPFTECEACKQRFRADDLISKALNINVDGMSPDELTKLIKDNDLVCPRCQGKLKDVRLFNMMFDVKVGVTGDDVMYLRPESAQSPYLAFKREIEALRRRLPLGLAVIGKVFRNEISPRQGFFRLREFYQAELQIFFDPEKINESERWDEVKDYEVLLKFSDKDKVTPISCEDANKKFNIPKFYLYNLAKVQQFYLDKVKVPEEKLRFRELSEKERAFYNKIHFDVEIDLPTLGGFKEVGGIHYRSDHDLGGHQKGSKETLEVVHDNKRILPHVLELSFGVDRNVWALMDLFFKEESERTLFKFPVNLVPLEVAIFPLVKKEGLPELAKKIYRDLSHEFKVFYDESGSIGRRYRRQDEVGTKFSITVDFDSLKNDDVTLRDRDSMEQVRIKISELKGKLEELFAGDLDFKDLK